MASHASYIGVVMKYSFESLIATQAKDWTNNSSVWSITKKQFINMKKYSNVKIIITNQRNTKVLLSLQRYSIL